MKSPRMMDELQFRALLRAAKDRNRRTALRDRFLFLFLGRTGLRISEALALTPRELYIQDDPPFVLVRTLKRSIPAKDEVLLDPVATKAVRRYLSRVLPQLLRRPVFQEDHLFPAAPRSGSAPAPAMTRRNALRLFRFYARRAGLPPGKTLHSLRHYRGTQLYERTRNLEFTREQLRHRRLDSTQVYIHSSPKQVRRYLDQLAGEGKAR